MNKINLPTLLTWIRVFLIPLFILVYYLPDPLISMQNKNFLAAFIFALAAMTDYLDGFLARLLKQESSFGAFLDPVADKAIIATSLVVLISFQRTFIFAAVIIIVREIAISALREWMAQLGQKQSIAVAYIGKIKTALQFAAIWLLLLDYHNGYINTNYIGNLFMLFAVIITVVSMIYYLNQAKQHF